MLIQGTGGVAIFALQFAKLFGATAIVTTSSDRKGEAARALGADHIINYAAQPRWSEEARRLAAGGIDHVIEVGGAETLEGALRAVRPGGIISLVGVLSGAIAPLNLPLAVHAAHPAAGHHGRGGARVRGHAEGDRSVRIGAGDRRQLRLSRSGGRLGKIAIDFTR